MMHVQDRGTNRLPEHTRKVATMTVAHAPRQQHKAAASLNFAVFGFFCLVMFVFTLKLVVENTGTSLEHIQIELTTEKVA